VPVLKSILIITLCILSVAFAGMNHAFAVPVFMGGGGRAAFLSPLERWMPTWGLDDYVSLLESAGYMVDVLVNEDVSVPFMKTALSSYDLIILRTDAFTLEGTAYWCTGEEVTITSFQQLNTTYATEIAAHELELSAACVGFSPTFIHDYYPAGSLHGLVYGLGSISMELSSAFISAGASVFLGFSNDIPLTWGRMDAFSIKFFSYMSQGDTVIDAKANLYSYLNRGHGVTASWIQLSYTGDGTFAL